MELKATARMGQQEKLEPLNEIPEEDQSLLDPYKELEEIGVGFSK